MNEVRLSGIVTGEPKVVEGKFWEFKVLIPRKSLTTDVLPVTIPLRNADGKIHDQDYVQVKGTFRSLNRVENGKGRLVLYVFGDEVTVTKEPVSPVNEIRFTGFLCKPVVYRITPKQFEIADLLVANNGAAHNSNYIPCIAWGRNAQFADDVLTVGSEVEIGGRIQSRDYEKVDSQGKSETRTAYEVSIGRLALLSSNLQNLYDAAQTKNSSSPTKQ